MPMSNRYSILRARLGDDGLLDLHSTLESTHKEWKTDVIETAGDRFERRLSEELGTFRVETTREFALVRLEIAASHNKLLRWMIGIAIAGLAVNYSIMTLLVDALKR